MPKTVKPSTARAGQPLGSQAQNTAPAAGQVGAASVQLCAAPAGQPLGSRAQDTALGAEQHLAVSMQLCAAPAGQAGTLRHPVWWMNQWMQVCGPSASGISTSMFYFISPTATIQDLKKYHCKSECLASHTVMFLLRLDSKHKGMDPILKENASLLVRPRQEDQGLEPSSGAELPTGDASLKDVMERRGEDPDIVHVHVKSPGAKTRNVRMYKKGFSGLFDAYCRAESLEKQRFFLFRELNATETGQTPILVDGAVFHVLER
jgi:hypothetical protein